MEQNWEKIYVQPNHFALYLKLTQYWKSTIVQFEKNLEDQGLADP